MDNASINAVIASAEVEATKLYEERLQNNPGATINTIAHFGHGLVYSSVVGPNTDTILETVTQDGRIIFSFTANISISKQVQPLHESIVDMIGDILATFEDPDQ